MPSRFTRKQIWRHNGAVGQARMMEMSALAIVTLPTVTRSAAATADQIASLARQLRRQLKERDE